MDTSGLMMVGMLLLGFSLAGAFVITMTLGAVRRLRELPGAQSPVDLDARLKRIEAAVEAIGSDVERLVEQQRIASRGDVARIAERATPPDA